MVAIFPLWISQNIITTLENMRYTTFTLGDSFAYLLKNMRERELENIYMSIQSTHTHTRERAHALFMQTY